MARRSENTSKQRRTRGGHVLSELVDHPLLLVDLIPQAGQLLVVQAAVRLPLLARSPLRETRLNMRTMETNSSNSQ